MDIFRDIENVKMKMIRPCLVDAIPVRALTDGVSIMGDGEASCPSMIYPPTVLSRRLGESNRACPSSCENFGLSCANLPKSSCSTDRRGLQFAPASSSRGE